MKVAILSLILLVIINNHTMNVLHEIFFALWFFLPAGIANMMPIFASRVYVLRGWDAPMDFGKNFRGCPILGSHKTWRGLVVGIVFATLTLWIQQLLVGQSGWLAEWTSQIDYESLPTLVLGPLFAIGALGGDAVESFFKRQYKVPPGEPWFPFDQTDYIVGGILMSLFVVRLDSMAYVTIFIVWALMHLLASYIGYRMKLKDKPI